MSRIEPGAGEMEMTQSLFDDADLIRRQLRAAAEAAAGGDQNYLLLAIVSLSLVVLDVVPPRPSRCGGIAGMGFTIAPTATGQRVVIEIHECRHPHDDGTRH